MILDLKNMPTDVIPSFKGGEKEFNIQQYNDEYNKIALGRLEPGASIGTHTHIGTCEIIYVVSGTGTATYNGALEKLYPGACHYCPGGQEHSILNDSCEPLIFFLTVNKQ